MNGKIGGPPSSHPSKWLSCAALKQGIPSFCHDRIDQFANARDSTCYFFAGA